MLVTSESNSGPPSRTPSILDSPTLARVERARLRLEASKNQREDSLERSILDPKHSLLAGRIPIESISGPIKRGLLWQQRDRLFSRWKERYFVLTRDYLHCFKRASGSATERISDMGQFIFKVKLVDVERVEWLNRRSYSSIGLLLGREGRVLLRCEHGLEDWFELLEECTLTSKERRRVLRIQQGPRSRASLAAPPSHSSLQTSHMGLGGTFSSALEDWLMTRHKTSNSITHFPLSDSVPDLTGFNENLNTPIKTLKKSSYIMNNNNNNNNNININSIKHNRDSNNNNNSDSINNNNIRYAKNGYSTHITNGNSNYTNNYYHQSPSRNNKNYINNSANDSNNNINNNINNDDENEVELRNGQIIRCENGNFKEGWMYRKPIGPNDVRHSLLTDIDISACDSGLDTPPSTHRPSSYRDVYYMNRPGARDSTDTGVSSSRGTLVSPVGSFRAANGNINGLRYSVQDKILRIRNEEDKNSLRSINNKHTIITNTNEMYDLNQNKCYNVKLNGNGNINNNYINNNNNNNINNINNVNGNTSIYRERYQHPALVALINEAQGIKFRDRSYSDIQQIPRRNNSNNNNNNNTSNNNNNNNNNSPSPRRRAFMGTPTRV